MTFVDAQELMCPDRISRAEEGIPENLGRNPMSIKELEEN